MARIFKEIPGYHVHDAMQMRSELWKMKNKVFVMIDYSKCGWTISQDIILSVLEVLVDYYPDTKVFQYLLSAYQSMPIIQWKDTDYRMQRGTMLGMLIELVTVASIASFEICKDYYYFPPEMKGWFNNDDTLLHIDKKELTNSRPILLEHAIGIYSKLGWSVHEKKPFVSYTGEWAKVWSATKFNQENETRQFSTLINGLDAFNISHAKHLYNSTYKRFWGMSDIDHEHALDALISFWGYEFHQSEITIPYEFGGWISNTKKGINYALLDYWKQPAEYRRVFLTKTPSVLPKLKKKDKKELKLFENLREFVREDEPYQTLMDWRSNIDHLAQYTNEDLYWSAKYKSRYIYKSEIQRKYCSTFYKRRQDQFKKQHLSYTDEYLMFIDQIKSKQWNNYAPPPEVVQHKPLEFHMQFDIPKCEDLTRYVLGRIHGLPVRHIAAPSGVLLGCLISNYPNKRDDIHSWSSFINQADRLRHFGNDVRIHDYMIDTYGYFYNLTIEPLIQKQDLLDLAIGKGTKLAVLDNLLIKYDDNIIKIEDKIDWIWKCPNILEAIYPNLNLETWLEFAQKVNKQEGWTMWEEPQEEEVFVPLASEFLNQEDEEANKALNEEYGPLFMEMISKRIDDLMPVEYREEHRNDYLQEDFIITLEGEGYDDVGVGGLGFGDSDSDDSD